MNGGRKAYRLFGDLLEDAEAVEGGGGLDVVGVLDGMVERERGGSRH